MQNNVQVNFTGLSQKQAGMLEQRSNIPEIVLQNLECCYYETTKLPSNSLHYTLPCQGNARS